jgi:hypothetical protein
MIGQSICVRLANYEALFKKPIAVASTATSKHSLARFAAKRFIPFSLINLKLGSKKKAWVQRPK